MNFRDCKNVTAVGSVTGNTVYISDDDALKIQSLRDKTNAEIDKWTEGLMETEALQVVLQKVTSRQRLVTITGHPGEGKTSLGYMVLKEMRKRGHDVFVVVTQADFFHIYVKVPKAIFMLDDILGAFTFDHEAYRKWESVIRELVKVDEHKISYEGMFDSKYETHYCALLIGRDNTFQEAKGHFGRYSDQIIGKDKVVDISHDVVLTDADKINILNYHCKKVGVHVSNEDCRIVCNISSPHGFPHCCRIYASIKKRESDLPSEEALVDLFSFFTSPLEFLDQTTNVYLRHPAIKEMFLLLLKSDGRIDTDSEEDDAKRERLKSVEIQLIDSYLKHDDYMVTFSHPSIYESVAFAVGTTDPVFVIKYCSLDFIMQRVRIGNMRKESDPRGFLYIRLTTGNKTQLIKRFVKELGQKNFYIIKNELFSDGDICEQILDTVLTSQRHVSSEDAQHRHSTIGVNDRDSENRTLLTIASKYGNTAAITTLIKHGADVNLTHQGETSLHVVCRNGHVDAVKQIIKHVDNVAQTDSCGRNAPYFVCESPNFKPYLISILFESGFTVDNSAALGPCIMKLCERKEKKALYTLAKCVKNKDNRKQLERFISHIFACMDANDEDLVCKEFEHPKFYGEEQMTRLNYLCRKSKEKTVRQLLSKMKLMNELDVIGMATIHYACCGNTIVPGLINLLIDHGADVNLPDSEGMTALHHLCLARTPEGVRAIVKEVGDIDAGCTRHKITPLHCISMVATNSEHVQIIRLLLCNNANPTAVNVIGLCALHYICARGIREGAEVMLSHIHTRRSDKNLVLGNDINDIFRKGQSVLHLACITSSSNLDIVKLLIDFGADVNAADSLGNRPLHYICNDAEHISWIIKREIFDSIEDVPGKIEQIRYDIAKYMIEMGANVHVRNDDGVESLHGKFKEQFEHEQMDNS